MRASAMRSPPPPKRSQSFRERGYTLLRARLGQHYKNQKYLGEVPRWPVRAVRGRKLNGGVLLNGKLISEFGCRICQLSGQTHETPDSMTPVIARGLR